MREKKILKYIFSGLFGWGILSAAPAAVARPTHRPVGLQVGMEYVNPLYYKYYRKQVDQQQEFHAAIDFSKVIVEGDYGWGRLAAEREGQYFRIGLNYNLAPETPDKNVAFLGLQHARSFLSTSSDTMTAFWHEVVAGVSVKVWKMIYVGSTLRYKFGLVRDEYWDSPHILGWGAYSDGAEETLGVTYYISLRIPLNGYRKNNNSPK